MALKYSIEYNDMVNINHRLEIYDDTYAGDEIEVNGTVSLDYSESEEILDPIKGVGLRVELDADSTLTFEDLYTEYEKDIKVIYKRDSVTKFEGWLNPEGWFEDFVDDRWVVSFDCIDGLSFLDNLSYTDPDGLNYLGKQTMLEIISNCLFRTGLEQDIRVDVRILYTGLSTSLDPMANAQVDAARFIKDDDDTIMSCQEVLNSILEVFGAIVVNLNNYWYIVKPNQLFASSTISYFAYNYDGSVHSTASGTVDVAFSIGSESEDFYPHHCSGNQSISNEKSLGGYRTNYKYGVLTGLMNNPYLDSSGATIFSWTVDSWTNLSLPANNRGVKFLSFDLDTSSIKNMTSDVVPLLTGEVVDLRLAFKTIDMPTIPNYTEATAPFRVKVVGATTEYFNILTGVWSTSAYSNKIAVGRLDVVTSKTIQLTIPIDGDLSVELWTPWGYLSVDSPPYDPEFQILYQEVSLTTVDVNSIIKGEFNTFQRTGKPNSKTEDVKEVFNGDNTSAVYLGTMYKADEITLTETWNRLGVSEEKSLLQIMGEDKMRLNANTKRIFSGNVYGFFDFLSVMSIDGFDGYFLPIKYRYNTKENIISAVFKQIFGDELTDIEYQKTADYGNTVKPTIRG